MPVKMKTDITICFDGIHPTTLKKGDVVKDEGKAKRLLELGLAEKTKETSKKVPAEDREKAVKEPDTEKKNGKKS